MTAWQSQQAWQIHGVASSCLLSGRMQVSWLNPWHQTQWAAVPVRPLGFWVALAKSGCFFFLVFVYLGKQPGGFVL